MSEAREAGPAARAAGSDGAPPGGPPPRRSLWHEALDRDIERTHDVPVAPSAPPRPSFLVYLEFEKRRDGMIHAMDGGLWLHRHVWKGHPMAHLVSTDRQRLLAYGRAVGLPERRLQFKPLKDPRTGVRRDAWHWDLVGEYLPEK